MKHKSTHINTNNKQGNRGDMRKIHVTWQFSEASGPRGHFFEKNKKCIFIYVQGDCLYQISGLCSFSLGQKVPTNPQTHKQTHVTSENRNTLDRLLASRGF